MAVGWLAVVVTYVADTGCEPDVVDGPKLVPVMVMASPPAVAISVGDALTLWITGDTYAQSEAVAGVYVTAVTCSPTYSWTVN